MLVLNVEQAGGEDVDQDVDEAGVRDVAPGGDAAGAQDEVQGGDPADDQGVVHDIDGPGGPATGEGSEALHLPAAGSASPGTAITCI